MFEGVIHSLLRDALARYFKPSISPSAVEASITSGNLRLSNLELKPDAFEFLQLPCQLSSGFIESIEAHIPWTSALSDQAKATLVVDNVVLIFVAKSNFTAEELAHRAHLAKMARLNQAEMMKRSRKAGLVKGEEDSASLSTRLVARLLANLEITIKGIQIRIDLPNSRDCVGMSLGSIKVNNVDLNAVQVEYGDTVKLLSITSCLVYANSLDVARHKQVLEVDLATLVMTTKDSGNVDLSLSAPRVAVTVDPAQVKTLSNLGANFSQPHPDYVVVAMGRPPLASPMNDPKAWWRFAYRAVVLRIRHKRYRHSHAYLARRRRDRAEYIGLWTKQMADKMSVAESNRLAFMERELSFEEIHLFRWCAENQAYNRELQSRRDALPEQPQVARVAVEGWLSWAFSSSASGNPSDKLTESEIEKMLAMLRDQAARLSVHATRTASLRLAEGSFSWSANGSAFSAQGLAQFKGLDVDFEACGGEITASLSCESLELDDPMQPSAFRRVVAPRAPSLPPLLSIHYICRPPSTSVTVRLAPVDFVHSPDFFTRLVSLLSAGGSGGGGGGGAPHPPSSSSLSARSSFSTSSPQSSPAITLDLEALSPVLILPSASKTHVLVIDFGRLSIKDTKADDANTVREYQIATSPVHVFTMDAAACPEWRDPIKQRELGLFVVQNLVMVAHASRSLVPSASPQFKVRAVLPSTVRCHISMRVLRHLHHVFGSPPASGVRAPVSPVTPKPNTLDESLAKLADAAASFMLHDDLSVSSPAASNAHRSLDRTSSQRSLRSGGGGGGGGGGIHQAAGPSAASPVVAAAVDAVDVELPSPAEIVLVMVEVDLQLLRVEIESEVESPSMISPMKGGGERSPPRSPLERAPTPRSENTSSEGYRTPPPPPSRQRSSSSQHTTSVARALLDALEEDWGDDDEGGAGAEFKEPAVVVSFGGIFASGSLLQHGRACAELSVDGMEGFLDGIFCRSGEGAGEDCLCRVSLNVASNAIRVNVALASLAVSFEAHVFQILRVIVESLPRSLPYEHGPPSSASALDVTSTSSLQGPPKVSLSLAWSRLSVELKNAALITVLEIRAGSCWEGGRLSTAHASLSKLNVVDDDGVLLLGQGSVDAPLFSFALSRTSQHDVDSILDSVIEEKLVDFNAREVISGTVSRLELHFRASSLGRVERWVEAATPPGPMGPLTSSTRKRSYSLDVEWGLKREFHVVFAQPLVDAFLAGGGKLRLLGTNDSLNVSGVIANGFERVNFAIDDVWLADDSIRGIGVRGFAVASAADAVNADAVWNVSVARVDVRLMRSKAERLWRLVSDTLHARPLGRTEVHDGGSSANVEPLRPTAASHQRVPVTLHIDAALLSFIEEPVLSVDSPAVPSLSEMRIELGEGSGKDAFEPPHTVLVVNINGVLYESVAERLAIRVRRLEARDSSRAVVVSRSGEGDFVVAQTLYGDVVYSMDGPRLVVNADVIKAIAIASAYLPPIPRGCRPRSSDNAAASKHLPGTAWRIRDAVLVLTLEGPKGFALSCAAASFGSAGRSAARESFVQGLYVVYSQNALAPAETSSRTLVGGIDVRVRGRADGASLRMESLHFCTSLGDVDLAASILPRLMAALDPFSRSSPAPGASSGTLKIDIEQASIRIDDLDGKGLLWIHADRGLHGEQGALSKLELSGFAVRFFDGRRWRHVLEPCQFALEWDSSAVLLVAAAQTPVRIELSGALASRMRAAFEVPHSKILVVRDSPQTNDDVWLNATGMDMILEAHPPLIPKPSELQLDDDQVVLKPGTSRALPSQRSGLEERRLAFELVSLCGNQERWSVATKPLLMHEEDRAVLRLESVSGSGRALYAAVSLQGLRFGAHKVVVESLLSFENLGSVPLGLRVGSWACTLPASARESVACELVESVWREPVLYIGRLDTSNSLTSFVGVDRTGVEDQVVDLGKGAFVVIRTCVRWGGKLDVAFSPPIALINSLPVALRVGVILPSGTMVTSWVSPGDTFKSHGAPSIATHTRLLLPGFEWSAPLARDHAQVRFGSLIVNLRWSDDGFVADVSVPWWVKDCTARGIILKDMQIPPQRTGMLSADVTSIFLAPVDALPAASMEWSLPIPLVALQAPQVIKCIDALHVQHVYALSTDFAPHSEQLPQPHRTQVLVVSDRIELVNATGFPLLVRQANLGRSFESRSGAVALESGQSRAWHWSDSRLSDEALSVRIADDEGWLFSFGSVLPASTNSLVPIMQRNRRRAKTDVLEARTTYTRRGVAVVTFQRAEECPFRFENATEATLRVWQNDVGEAFATVVPPRHAFCFCWDVPSARPQLRVHSEEHGPLDVFALDEGAPQLRLYQQGIRAAQRMDGATRVLVVTDDAFRAPRAPVFPQISHPVEVEVLARRCLALRADLLELVVYSGLDRSSVFEDALVLRLSDVELSNTEESSVSESAGARRFASFSFSIGALDLLTRQTCATHDQVQWRQIARVRGEDDAALNLDLVRLTRFKTVDFVQRMVVNLGSAALQADDEVLNLGESVLKSFEPRRMDGGEPEEDKGGRVPVPTVFTSLAVSLSSLRVSLHYKGPWWLRFSVPWLVYPIQITDTELALPPLRLDHVRTADVTGWELVLAHARASVVGLGANILLSIRVCGVDALPALVWLLTRNAWTAGLAVMVRFAFSSRGPSLANVPPSWSAVASLVVRFPVLAFADVALQWARQLDHDVDKDRGPIGIVPRAPRGVVEGFVQAVGLVLPELAGVVANHLLAAPNGFAGVWLFALDVANVGRNAFARLATGVAWDLKRIFCAVARSAGMVADVRLIVEQGENTLDGVKSHGRFRLEGGGWAAVLFRKLLVTPSGERAWEVDRRRIVLTTQGSGSSVATLWMVQSHGEGLYQLHSLGFVKATLCFDSVESATQFVSVMNE